MPPAKPASSSAFLHRLQVELTGRRLAFNFLFHGLHLFLFAWGWYSQQTNAKLAALNGLRFSVWTSRGAGLVLAFDGGLILVPSASPALGPSLRARLAWAHPSADRTPLSVLRNVIRLLRPKLTWLFPADENIWRVPPFERRRGARLTGPGPLPLLRPQVPPPGGLLDA